MKGVMTEMPITTTEEKAQRRLEVKAISTLMIGIPNEHHYKKDSRNLLKQQYKNFTASSSEMLDKTLDRLQKLVSQNKADLDRMSMDDRYNNLKVFEPKVKEMSNSSSSTQNMAFVSSSNNNTSSTNEAVNTAHKVSTASTQVNAANSTNIDNLSDAVICIFFTSQPNSPQLVHEDLQQIYPDDMEEMDLRWQMAMLTMRARRFLKNLERKLTVNRNKTIGFDKSKSDQAEEGPNYALMAFSSSCPDLKFVNEPVVENIKAMSSEEEPKVDCNYHQKQFQNQRMVKPVWNNAQRVNHQNFAKKTHPCAKKNMVPRAVLMKSGLVSINTARQNISKIAVLVNTARQVNAAHSKTTVNAARPMSYLSKTAHSTVKRPIHKNTTFKNSNINQRVNTVRGKKFNTARPKAVVNAVKGNNFNVVKASACWVWKPKTKVLYHVSKHNSASITLKKFDCIDAQARSKSGTCPILEYKEIDGGYVAFGGNSKGGKIIGKEVYLPNFLKTIKPVLLVKRESSTEPLVPVTILNTIDHLGKFDGKADEGFFVGYSLNSKAFRVFNSRTRIVEENLHIRFSESTPNVVGSGPDWLFDIDALTRIMNYEPIVVGTQSNGFAGIKASDNAGQARKETEPVKDYILLPLWTADPPFFQDPKSSHDDGSKPSSDNGKKVIE
ncbi:ribonuclease H-like domain-containing protein [Tanacetum coccineum]|uniref:Ribonuclease H-like domain-containing protein n=1 Tax=Tanacetum coccineum TaxID=301880 RepID=A0ABQ5ADE1_9ASTR